MDRIINQVKFIGGALSLIIVTILLSILYINKQGKTDSVVINMAGKQRMLTQKISKYIFKLSTSSSSKVDELLLNIEEFDSNLLDLINGNEKIGIYRPPTTQIKEQLQRVRSQWIPFKEVVEKFINYLPKVNSKKSFVFENNTALLKYSDDIVKMMVKSNIDGAYIDMAGKQRMLSQRMMYHILMYLNDSNPKYYSMFKESFREYDKTIRSFSQDRLFKKYKEVDNLINENLLFWKTYSVEANELIDIQSSINSIRSYVSNVNNSFLDNIDQSVSIYSLYSESQRSLIEKIEYILGIVALLIMLYSVVLTKNIENLFTEFLTHSKDLTKIVDIDPSEIDTPPKCLYNNELIQANSHINSFIKKIDLMILDARKAIATSKNIANELSNVSDMMQDNISSKNPKIEKFIDDSEDIAIQSIEDLQSSEKLLEKLHKSLLTLLEKDSLK